MSTPELTQAALDLTFNAIKSQQPSLALKIQNHLEGKRNIQESYPISLNEEEIKQVITSLTTHLQTISDPGMLVVIKALIEDWQTFLQ